MYTLRTVFQTGIERNNYLGKNYEVIKPESKEEFEYYFNDVFPNPEINDTQEVFALLITDEITIPLYRTHSYYIVGEKGKTFSNLTAKNNPFHNIKSYQVPEPKM